LQAHGTLIPREAETMTTERPTAARPKRSWFQFSIKALLGLTVFVALGCAALLNASEWWASAACTVTLAVLLIAVLASIFRWGPRRAFWLGFAIVGWAYVLLTFWPAPDPSLVCQRHLLTTKLTDWAYYKVLPLVRTPPKEPAPLPPIIPPPAGGYYGGPVGYNVRNQSTVTLTAVPPAAPASAPPPAFYPDHTDFLTVAEWLWALVLAMLGGLLARFLYATGEAQT
jgi:hypothetical protein